ncbi:MAG: TIGR04086 family membrane protein [Butyricicoccus pullicaecorum]|nr:TIGR04086 family membrane protein [Butyricicoccus pullicaecorum]
MKQNDVRPMAGFVLGAAVLCGFVLTLLSMSMCALAVLMGKLPAEQIDLWADLCLAAGSLFAAFFAARHAHRFQPLWGLAAGGLLFGCLVLLSLAWFGEPVYVPRLLINAILALACAAGGGALGAKRRRRRKHRK